MVPQVVKFFNIFKNTWKMYFFVHLIPVVLYKRKDLKKKPLRSIVKFVLGWLRSMLFVCGFALISRRAWCRGISNGKISYSTILGWYGLAACAILIEAPSRMSEYPMNLLPRYFESMPTFFGKMKLFPNIPFGMNMMAGIAFALVASVYFTDNKSIKSQLRWLISCILGDSQCTEEEKKEAEVPSLPRKVSSKD